MNEATGLGNHNGIPVTTDAKTGPQATDRGWTPQDIRDTIAQGPIGVTTDNRRASNTPDGVKRNDSATVYGTRTGYVVINDRTGEVVQVSDKIDPKFIPDSRIIFKGK